MLAVITVAKGLFWMALFPVFKITDEPSHFENVQYRAEHARVPRFDPNALPEGKVMHDGAAPEVLLAWRITNQLWRSRFLPDVDRVPEEDELRRMARDPANRRGDGQISSMNYPGAYYDLGVLPYLALRHSSVLARVEAVRLVSLAFGVLAVLATFLAARRMMKSRALAVAAAMLVCLQPMVTQMTIGVNNDAGLIGFSAVILYLAVRFVVALPAVPSWKWGALFGLVAALNVLTKPHAYGLLPACALVCALVVALNLRDRRAWIFAGCTALVFAIIVAPEFISSLRAGSLVPGKSGPGARLTFWSFLHRLDAAYAYYLFRSFVAQFGWLEYYLPAEMLEPVQSLGLLAIGLVVAFVARVVAGRGWLSTRGLLIAIFVAVVGVLSILFAEYRFRTVGLSVIQGRHLLFIFPAVALAMAAGIGALVPARLRTLGAALLTMTALLFHLTAIVFIARYHYGS